MKTEQDETATAGLKSPLWFQLLRAGVIAYILALALLAGSKAPEYFAGVVG